jgi:1-deoxy-D-xylulose-5-phosphate reductoisomerase
VAVLNSCDDLEGVVVITGDDANEKLIDAVEADIYLIALSGTAGILPTYKAVSTGKRVALANKESLVSAGKFITERSRLFGSEIIPVDSEHSAIFQCLLGQDRESVRRIILTASGGPFLNTPKEELVSVTPEDALAHPCWDMGPKVTIDSATMMNKGLEVIEARWLFDIPRDMIKVLVHPQAVIHSMVEFIDGSVLAQLGCPDMRIPISFALGYPVRINSGATFLDLAGRNLSFEEPDMEKFPLLRLAYEALDAEDVWPVILNAANEVAVNAFLKGKIRFTDIPQIVERCMQALSSALVENIEDVMQLHRRAVSVAYQVVHEVANI